MSEVTPRKSLRRRRLTIAALVLLVLGGGLWWSTRPRIDPRLVGTWKCSQPPRYSMVLHADGKYERFDTGPDDLFGPLTWKVDGDFLVVSFRREKAHRGLLERLQGILNGLRGADVYQKVRILEVTATMLRLETLMTNVESGTSESPFQETFTRVK